MHLYNLIEYSDNYSDRSGSLWQFKKDEYPINGTGTKNTEKTKVVGNNGVLKK